MDRISVIVGGATTRKGSLNFPPREKREMCVSRPPLEPPTGALSTSMPACQSRSDGSSRWNHITCSDCNVHGILLGLADVLVRRPCTAVLVAWVASARGRSACRRRRKPGQKKIFLRQRSPQPRRKQARTHRQVAGQPNGLLRLHRLASSFALRRAGPFVSSKERTFGRPEGS